MNGEANGPIQKFCGYKLSLSREILSKFSHFHANSSEYSYNYPVYYLLKKFEPPLPPYVHPRLFEHENKLYGRIDKFSCPGFQKIIPFTYSLEELLAWAEWHSYLSQILFIAQVRCVQVDTLVPTGRWRIEQGNGVKSL